MKDIVIIQCRMSSKRLPGKVLAMLQGKLLLEHVVDRVKRSYVKHIVVATSTERLDDQVEAFCRSIGVECFRGELDDVTKRFEHVIEKTGAERFVRICGDSPFIDPALINQAVMLFDKTGADIVTNVLPRTFPKGQSVEMLRSDIFLKVQPVQSVEHKEHVTKYFYENASHYKIENFVSDGSWGDRNMCIDTFDDMGLIQKVFADAQENLDKKGWHELMELMEKVKGSL